MHEDVLQDMESANELKLANAVQVERERLEKAHKNELKVLKEQKSIIKAKYDALKSLHVEHEARTSFFKWKVLTHAVR